MPKLKLAGATMVFVVLFVFAPNALAGFLPPVQYGTGINTNPQDAAIGDLNADGFADIVSSNNNSDNVAVLINNGDGTFLPQVSYPAGDTPQSVAIGDLNGDSSPDLAVPNRDANTVSVLLNDGDGTFGAPTPFAVGSEPSDVAIGQFDDDGFLDLAATNYDTNPEDSNVTVLYGDGEGSFGDALGQQAGPNPVAITSGDLNGDGHADLAVAGSTDGKVAILMYLPGPGYFDLPVTYAAGQSPSDVALSDLDGNGDLDMVVSDINTDNALIFLGNGDGTFLPNTAFGVGDQPLSVAVGDLTGDGIPDIATANNNSVNGNNATVLAGNGDGTFGAAVNYPAGARPWSVAFGDLDSDLNLDMAVATRDDQAVSVLMNDAPEAVASTSILIFPAQSAGTAEERTFTVTNASGGGALTVSSSSLNGPNPTDFSIVGNTCLSASIPLLGTCEVTVRFSPSVVGARSATLSLNYNSSDSPLEIVLSGIGTDATPPNTVINSGPSGTITTNSATFTFSGSPAADTAKIMCKLDGAAFADCTSPKSFPGLANGSHTVSFRAEDAAGNQDPTPATRTFTVKTAVPPVAKAKIGKVTVKGPARVKKGKKVTYRVKITNSGKAAATGVRLKVNGRGLGFNAPVGKIAAGKTRTIEVKVKARKPGKVKATFKVTSGNAGSKTVRKRITVRK